MRYMLLIHQGSTPTPRTPEDWARLSEAEQQAVYADYQAVSSTPGVTPGEQMDEPETATTVRVENGEALTTDGPFAEGKEHIGGFSIVKAPDLDAALEWGRKLAKATTLPVEVRPVHDEQEHC